MPGLDQQRPVPGEAPIIPGLALSVSNSLLAWPGVLEGVTLDGRINTSDEEIAAHIKHSIRLGYPQVRPVPPQPNRIALVGGGPSLEQTEQELWELSLDPDVKIVTVNGSYQWCLDHHFRPSAHIVMDARASNARFVDPPIPNCRYYLSSQCHPDTWARVKGREYVVLFHSTNPDNELIKPILDAYYLRQWFPVVGGSTVVTRALGLLRMTGFVRYDLFGVDSCFLDGKGHAYPQPENDKDRRFVTWAYPSGHPEMRRKFVTAGWHLQQLSDVLTWMRHKDNPFVFNVHGEGLLAYALQAAADLVIDEEEQPEVQADPRLKE